MKSLRILSLLTLYAVGTGYGQQFDQLNVLEGYATTTYYSTGADQEALAMAARCDRVLYFYSSMLKFEPQVTLLVLSKKDWSTFTQFPVYGMPHYNDNKTLVVAAEDNDFWKSFIPPLDQLSEEMKENIIFTYSNQKGELSMRGFFDLLAIHELGHAYHIQGGLTMHRKWMGELFANILLHSYIAENEHQLLPALTLFPEMVVSSTNKEDLKFTTLQQLEENYDLIGQQYPNNYGWYQCRWHVAAHTIYDQGGLEALQKLWEVLKGSNLDMDDNMFEKLLRTEVHPSVTDVPLKWDQ